MNGRWTIAVVARAIPECLRQNLFKAGPFQGQLGVSKTSARCAAIFPPGEWDRARGCDRRRSQPERTLFFEPGPPPDFPRVMRGTVRQHVFAPPALFAVCCFRLKGIVAVGSDSASIVR